MADNSTARTLKLTRKVLAIAFKGDNQAIKAMEGLQDKVFTGTPDDIKTIIARLEMLTDEVMQAAIVASQPKSEPQPYLHAVSVPLEPMQSLSAVDVSLDCQTQLQAV